MKRDNHHCPGEDGPVGSGPTMISSGGCRWTDDPVRHCKTHMNYCIEHNKGFMKNKECPSCVMGLRIR
jgi:hypothetical protein